MRLLMSTEEDMSEEQELNIVFLDDVGSLNEFGIDEQNVLETNESQQPAKDNYSDWRKTAQSFGKRNLFALKNSMFTDITLEVGPDNVPFQVHKLILALGSPVFEAMFYGPLAEKGEKVNIPDILPDGFKVLIRFLYTDVVALHNEFEALHAWVAADKYCVPQVKEECNRFFENCPVSFSNIWQLFENAVLFSLQPLLSRCKNYLSNHTDSALQSNNFLETSIETIKELLQVSYTNISELVLLKCVIHWGKHSVQNSELVSLTDKLKPLLALIRFGALTPVEFCQFLDETGNLLEESDALAILKHLTQPLVYALPEWCCKTTWQRISGSFSSFAHCSYNKRFNRVRRTNNAQTGVNRVQRKEARRLRRLSQQYQP